MKRKESASNSDKIASNLSKFENENHQNSEVSAFKIITSQIVALLPVIFISMRIGIGNGFTTELISELSKTNTEINVSLGELTWFSSYFFVIPVATIPGGFLAYSIGVRRLLMFCYLLYIIADLLFHWAGNAEMILVAQTLVGLSDGLAKGPSFTYSAEIAQSKFRSITMASLSLSTLFGAFFATFLGNFMHWRAQTFVYIGLSLIGLIIINFIPDSPLWLASKNRFEDAVKSLARLRGWTTPESVRAELYSSIKCASDSLSSAETATENHLNTGQWKKLKKTMLLFIDRSFYIPLLTVSAMFFLTLFNGAQAMTYFAGLIFEEIKSPVDPSVGSALFTAISVVSAFVYIFIVGSLGKRLLALTSVIIITVCFIVAATFIYLNNDNSTSSETYSWIVTIALSISLLAHYTGIGKIIYFINSELFPQKLRYVGAGIGFFVFEIVIATLRKVFLYLLKAITFPGALVFFIIVNIVAFVVTYFILPETEGVTLREIEEHYNGTQNLKNKNNNK